MGHSADEHGSRTSVGALTIDKGYVTARVSTGAHMDAAVVDTLAGLELSVDTLAARFGDASPGFRGDRTISLSMTPDAMRELYELLGRKLGLAIGLAPSDLRDAASMIRTPAEWNDSARANTAQKLDAVARKSEQ